MEQGQHMSLLDVKDALDRFERAVAMATLVNETGTSEEESEDADHALEAARAELLRLLDLNIQ